MRIAFVLKGYPRLSETFIAQEIHGLERRGFDLTLWPLRRPSDPYTHPVHDEVAAPVVYLPQFLHEEPARLRAGWLKARCLPGFRTARTVFMRDLARDFTRNRVRRFGQACVLAAELPAGIDHLHAHFLHTPASVTRYAAIMRGLRWSVSAHARDIWTIPGWEKHEKLRDAAFAVTCSACARTELQTRAERGRVELIYHGLDFSRFPPAPERLPRADGADGTVVMLSVGRAVAKKGYDVLLQALARLPADLNWRFVHIGGGPLLERLQAQAGRLGLAERITWHGRQPQNMVLKALRGADLFVLPSVIADDGDRDGLPNVLMEAQSQRLPCVASRISAVPELIEDGVTGLLFPPDDPQALAAALVRLVHDPALRERLGRAGEARVHSRFGAGDGLDQLADLFRRHVIPSRSGRAA